MATVADPVSVLFLSARDLWSEEEKDWRDHARAVPTAIFT